MQLFLRKQVFSLLLVAVVGLAIFFPQPVFGSRFLNSAGLTGFILAIIFFLQGLSLPTHSLVAGYKPLRLHGFVLFWNFICFPAITLLLLYPIARIFPADVLLGFGALAFLPTTIASATAYTAISNGAVANAIVSTALSNLLAVFVVPAVAVIYFKLEPSIDIPFGKVLLSLIQMLVTPLALGQIVQRLVRLNTDRTAKMTKPVSAGLILLIVYLAFARSINSEIFDKISFLALTITLFAVVLLLLVTSVLVWLSAHWMGLEMPQRVAAFYCSSQKSLAAGLPLVSSILLSIPDMGNIAVIFIPLFFFHPLQMLLAGIVAPLLKSKDNALHV